MNGWGMRFAYVSSTLALMTSWMIAFAFTTITTAATATPTPTPLVARQSNFSPEIIKELKDFLHLIPPETVDEIAAKHYLFDSGFRKSMKYLRSPQFKLQLQTLQHIPEIVEILQYLHLQNRIDHREQQHHRTRHYYVTHSEGDRNDDDDNVADTDCQDDQNDIDCRGTFKIYRVTPGYGIDRMVTRKGSRGVRKSSSLSTLELQPVTLLPHSRVQLSRINEMPLEIQLLPEDENVTSNTVHSFTSFTEELTEHLPRSQYVEMINEKQQRSTEFAEFYEALRNKQFEFLVEMSLKSPNLTTLLQTLNNNKIDVHALKPILFRVISWGPPPREVTAIPE